MTKFCTECGKEIQNGVAFCTDCGTKAPVDSIHATIPEAVNVTENTATEIKTEPKVEAKMETPPAADPINKVVGTGTYFGLLLLFALPIIGFIVCIIMCSAPKNKNLKHFARANLIWAIIGLIIGGLIIGGIYMLSNSLMDYINSLTDGQFGGWGDLFGNLGILEGLIEQFGTGGLEGLPIE